jgi:prepilin-type processing-associated H-X9-DG protein
VVVLQVALGLGVSAALLLFGYIVAVVAVRPSVSAQKAVCLTNTKRLALATRMYAEEWHDTLPEAEIWCEALLPYTGESPSFVCPVAADLDCAFAYNRALGGMTDRFLHDPMSTVAIFESDAGWNAAGGPELLPTEPRHLGGDNYGFADGHAAWMARKWQGTADARTWNKRPTADVIWEVDTRPE